MLLNILQCTEPLSTTENDLTPNGGGAQVKKACRLSPDLSHSHRHPVSIFVSLVQLLMEQQFFFVRLERFDHFRPSFNRVAGAGLVTTGLGLCQE